MEIIRTDPETLAIRGINAFAASLLRRIPFEADPGGDAAARARLYTKPTQTGQGRHAKELNEEWAQYVEPELRHLFQTANETVFEDLKQIHKTGREHDDHNEETYEMVIPVVHIEQWLNTLNQARLVMAARNGFTDEELESDFPMVINSTREMNLFQIHFYGNLQAFLIQEIER
ncbi:MAG TPA: hypothetical protein VG733_18040 [Chthoniobacteraceae bacterium]|nr:hypothetical protein [Chthoniobacteraceae bacterium]